MKLEMKAKSLMCFAVIACAIPALALKQDPEYRQARHEGAEAKFELRVVDDDDVPVEGATVKVFMGMNYREKGYWLNGETNTNGTWVLQGKTCGNEIEIGITKDGYYDSNRKMCLATMGAEHEVKDGKWQPWGKEERIILRKIRNPIKMVHLSKNFLMPATNSFIGFDMKVADWVNPYGKGEYADFCIKYFGDGIPVPNYKQIGCIVAFTNCFCGAYIERKFMDSEFKTPYVAKTNAHYLTSFEYIRKIDSAGQMFRRELADAEDLIARTRCVIDNEGRLVKCNYCRIGKVFFNTGRDGTGETLLEYDFNSTPNDTNLEPKR